MGDTDLPTIDDVRAAAARLAGVARRTPALAFDFYPTWPMASQWLKCENLQRTGSFKFRGAMNALLAMDEATRRRGVATHSSGNHGAALAYAAWDLGIESHVVVPTTISPFKLRAIEEYATHVEYSLPTVESREATLAAIVARTGAGVVHPYDDARVMAGQGTIALEFLEQVPDLDVLLVPVSGGGLIGGVAIAAHGVNPAIEVYGVEPELAADARRSLATGALAPAMATTGDTIADGLRASLSPRTFSAIREHVHDVLMVSEQAILSSMEFVWETAKLVIEPSSAVVPAAAHVHMERFKGKRVGMVLTGGNVALDRLPWQPASSTTALAIAGYDFVGEHVRTKRANVLMIRASDGFLGCGYFDLAAAERLGEPVAIVTGVKAFDEMLAAPVVRASSAARALGVVDGMSGREALLAIERGDLPRSRGEAEKNA